MLFLITTGAHNAHAVCFTSTMGNKGPGSAFFNQDSKLMAYCNDTSWVKMGSPSISYRALNNLTPNADDNFGRNISVSGKLAVIGAYWDESDGASGVNAAGRAYVYNIYDGSLVSIINNPNINADDRFASDVAISGNTVLVGAYWDESDGGAGVNNAGRAYVFDALSGALLRAIDNPSPNASDHFGVEVALHGELALIAADSDESDGNAGVNAAGRAYVFNVNTGELISTLNNPSPNDTDRFGNDVSIHGDIAVIGVYRDESDGGAGIAQAGRAYVFNARTGELISTLNNPTPDASDYFGFRTATDGEIVVISAIWDEFDGGGGGDNHGRAYVFDAQSGSLNFAITNPIPNPSDNFGSSVAIGRNVIAIGADQDGPDGSTGGSAEGRVYLFDKETGNFIRPLNNPTADSFDYFGRSVSISGDAIVVGAHIDSELGQSGVADAGRAYVFNLNPRDVDYDGLVGHWKLDETSGTTVIDYSSSNSPGSLQGGLDPSTDSVPGKAGTAYDFDGSGKYVNIGNGAETSFGGTAPFTITAWVNMNSVGYGNIISKYGTTAGSRQFAVFTSATNELRCLREAAPYAIQGTTVMQVGTWYHIACHYDGTTLKVFVNGAEENSAAHGSTNSPATETYIGSNANTGDANRHFDGLIDDVRIYNRALSVAEINELYQARDASLRYNVDNRTPEYFNGNKWISVGPIKPSTTGLVGHWKLDEASGTIIDSSGNGLDGTALGTVYYGSAGVIGSALGFDTTLDPSIDFGDEDAFDFSDENAFTISVWAYPIGSSGSALFNRGQYNTGALSQVISFGRYVSNPARWFVELSDGTTVPTIISTAGTVSEDEWQHMVLTWDGSNLILYKDNVVLNNVSAPGFQLWNPSNSVYRETAIGSEGRTNTDNNWNGMLDDVRVYNRALSASEVTDLYHSRGQPFTPNAVTFDGATNLRGSFIYTNPALSVDTNAVTGSLWFRRNAGFGTLQYITHNNSTFFHWFNGSDEFQTSYTEFGTGDRVRFTTTQAFTDTNWHHIAWSFHTADQNSLRLYVDGISQTPTVTDFDENINIRINTASNFAIGSEKGGGADYYDGDMAEFWLSTSAYIDLDDPSNLAKFYRGGPVYLGENGEIPLGRSPELFLSSATVNWHTNKGTGLGFGEFGTGLTDAGTTPPSGSSIGTCSNPTRFGGEIIYNDDNDVLQYCDGVNWIGVGYSVTTTGGPTGCPTIGDLCSDGSLFAGDTNLYVTDVNQSALIQWKGSLANDDINPDSFTSGEDNHANVTVAINSLLAIDLCETLDRHGHQDWYLPARDELSVLYTNSAAINANAGESFNVANYWSSTENDTNTAIGIPFNTGTPFNFSKINLQNVRCVRRQ